MADPRAFSFFVASVRAPGHLGNTEWLARRAAAALPTSVPQAWHHLASLNLPPFVDQRHTIGSYPAPEGDLALLLDATLSATDLVFVAPVYWYSLPASLKTYLEHWSAWMRVPDVPFRASMAEKTLWLVTTSGDRERAQPLIDTVRLCAEFLNMRWGGALHGRGGAPGVVEGDAEAVVAAAGFFGERAASGPS